MKYKIFTLFPSLCTALGCAALSLALSGAASAAAIATAGQDDGYSGRILDKIVAKWKAPRQKAGTNRLKLILSVDGDGKLLDCKVQQASGIAGFDESVCAAAKAASPYGTPPYGIPATVYFSFWSGGGPDFGNDARQPQKSQTTAKKTAEGEDGAAQQASPAMSKSKERYVAKITREARKSIYIPVETKPGVYHVTVRVECDKQGNIISSQMLKSSPDARLNKYVMQGIARAKKVSPPAEGMGNSFDLNFTLVRQGGEQKKASAADFSAGDQGRGQDF